MKLYVQLLCAVRLGLWQSQTSNICSEMTGQWSDSSAMSSHKTLSPPDPLSYLHGFALRIWTSFWKREGAACMYIWNTPIVQSRQPLTYRLMESMDLGGPRWHGSSWQRQAAESGSSRLSTLMIDILEIWCEICHVLSKPATWKGPHWCGCCPCTRKLIKNLLMMLLLMMMMMMMTLLNMNLLSYHFMTMTYISWSSDCVHHKNKCTCI